MKCLIVISFAFLQTLLCSVLLSQSVFNSATDVVVIADNFSSGVSASLNIDTGSPAILNSFDSITIHALNHDYAGHLRASITHTPTGKSAILFDRPGGAPVGTSSNFTMGDFTFEFGALQIIEEVALLSNLAPGIYAPASQTPGNVVDSGADAGANDKLVDFLSFAGIDPNGEWLLEISDNESTDIGSFAGFSITLNYVPVLNLMDVAQTKNQQALAAVLDPLVVAGGNSTDLNDFFSELTELTDDEVRSALDQMSPRYLGMIPQVFASHNSAQTQNIWNRLVQVRRSQGTPIHAVNLNFRDGNGNQDSRASTQRIALTGPTGPTGPTGLVPQSKEQDWGLYTIGTGQTGDVDDANEEVGFDFQTTGINVGADYYINKQLVAGVTLGYSSGDAELDDDGGQVDTDSLKVGVYATYFEDGSSEKISGWYVNGYLGGGYNEYDCERTVSAGTISQTAKGDSKGYELNSVIGGGYDYQLGDATIVGLITSLRYDRLWVDDYSESGAGSLGLDVDDQDLDSLRSDLGVRVAYSVVAIDDIIWHWGAQASWQHEFMDTENTVKARLVNGGSASFNTDVNQDISADTLSLGASLSGEISTQLSVGVAYFAEINEDYTSNTLNFSIAYGF
jgi:outer membrane autotransporter protein